MDTRLFKKLLAGAEQAQDISKGKAVPSRKFLFRSEDIVQIRKGLNLSQNMFADLLQVPASTLRNWEQGRTTPDAPAQTLLLIAHKRPDVLGEVTSERKVVYGRRRAAGKLNTGKTGRSLNKAKARSVKRKSSGRKKASR